MYGYVLRLEKVVVNSMYHSVESLCHVNGLVSVVALLVMSICLPKLGVYALVPVISLCINGVLLVGREFLDMNANSAMDILEKALCVSRRVMRILVLVVLLGLFCTGRSSGRALSLLLLVPIIIDGYIRAFYWNDRSEDINISNIPVVVKTLIRPILVLLLVVIFNSLLPVVSSYLVSA